MYVSVQNINDSVKQKIQRSFRKLCWRVPAWVQERKIHGRCHQQVVEKFYKQGSALHILYIDFKQAFDSVR